MILSWSCVHQTVTQSAKNEVPSLLLWINPRIENFYFPINKIFCFMATSSNELLLFSLEFSLRWTEIDTVIDFYRLSSTNHCSLFLYTSFLVSLFLIRQLNFMHEYTFATRRTHWNFLHAEFIALPSIIISLLIALKFIAMLMARNYSSYIIFHTVWVGRSLVARNRDFHWMNFIKVWLHSFSRCECNIILPPGIFSFHDYFAKNYCKWGLFLLLLEFLPCAHL